MQTTRNEVYGGLYIFMKIINSKRETDFHKIKHLNDIMFYLIKKKLPLLSLPSQECLTSEFIILQTLRKEQNK